MSASFRALSRVSLKHYPAVKGRIRTIEYGLKDEKRGKFVDVASVYWDDGKISKCPTDCLNLESFYTESKYPWEKYAHDEEKPNPEVAAGKHD